jgi:hypothetical protein
MNKKIFRALRPFYRKKFNYKTMIFAIGFFLFFPLIPVIFILLGEKSDGFRGAWSIQKSVFSEAINGDVWVVYFYVQRIFFNQSLLTLIVLSIGIYIKVYFRFRELERRQKNNSNYKYII